MRFIKAQLAAIVAELNDTKEGALTSPSKNVVYTCRLCQATGTRSGQGAPLVCQDCRGELRRISGR